jgi:DNA-directed RNA polymerase specialized sigma24 family protein
LEALLMQLRPDERGALYLNAVEGYTAREIAKQTDMPRNTVLSLIFKARKKLVEIIAPDHTDVIPKKETK